MKQTAVSRHKIQGATVGIFADFVQTANLCQDAFGNL
jgi:hypothetical protein